MKPDMLREINGRFLLNEHGDPVFLYINFSGTHSSTIYIAMLRKVKILR